MPSCTCENCRNEYAWTWHEAFDKFGFSDGDGQVMTHVVENVLTRAGYQPNCQKWGLHNVVITSIKKDGRELIPDDAKIGYDDPRGYLPEDIVRLLDQELPESEAVS